MKEKPEDLELKPIVLEDLRNDGSDQPSPIKKVIDALVPRDGNLPPTLCVSHEEYLSRLASLWRKTEGVRWRKEQWDRTLEQQRERFATILDMEPPDATGIPPGGIIYTKISVTDIRVDGEFEAFLFAVRSSLDVLARVVTSHLRGIETSSYHKLVGLLERHRPGSELHTLIRSAWDDWASDLTTRRDAAGHYVALTAISETTATTRPDAGTSITHFFAAIPKDAKKESGSIWWTDPPVLGSPSRTTSSLSLPGRDKIEAHALFDEEGRLILRRNGPLPPRPEHTDASKYVASVVEAFSVHVERVLSTLQSVHCAVK